MQAGRHGQGSSETNGGRELRISGGKSGPKLTAAQRKFNQLVRKVEETRRRIQRRTDVLNGQLQFTVSVLIPLEERVAERSAEVIRALWKCAGERAAGLGRRQRMTLKAKLAGYFNWIFDVKPGPVVPDLEAIWTRVGEDEPEPSEDEVDFIRDQVMDALEQTGLAAHVDPADLDFLKPGKSFPEMQRGMEEFLERLQEQMSTRTDGPQSSPGFEAGPDPEADPSAGARASGERPGSKAEERRRLREAEKAAARARSLTDIYRQLAKVLHPDLEPDPDRKREKEALMQQLNVAQESGDLHTLLRLELDWLRREEGDIARLTDAKLRVYNEVLKEQVASLEEEFESLQMHPRYERMGRIMDSYLPFGIFDGELIRELILSREIELENVTKGLQGSDARRWLSAWLREQAEIQRRSERMAGSIFGF